MPQMSGQHLAEGIGEIRPELPILFTSGHSQAVLHSDQAAGKEMPFIQKPFTEQALLERVHAILTGEGRHLHP